MTEDFNFLIGSWRGWPQGGFTVEITETLLAQLECEVPTTRKALERVPAGRNDWKPHPRSTELGYLSVLIAILPSWIVMIVDREYLDLGAGGAPPSGNLLDLFDKAVAGARRALSHTSDARLMQPWQLRVNGKVVDEKPRYIMI